MSLVERSLDVIEEHDVTMQSTFGNLPVGYVISPATYTFRIPAFTGRYEKLMSDDSPDHRVWKQCEHYVRIAEPGRLSLSVRDPWRNIFFVDFQQSWYSKMDIPMGAVLAVGTTYGGASAPISGLGILYSPGADGHFIDPPADLGNLIQRGLDSVLPGLRKDVSLVNSIIELKDWRNFHESVDLLADFFRRVPVRSLLKLAGKKVQNVEKMSLREVLRVVGDSYLQYEFNFAPSYSDIKGIFNSFKKYQAAIMRQIRSSESLQTRHFTADVLESNDTDEVVANTAFNPVYGTTNSFASSTRRRSSQTTKFHLEVEYNYSYSAFQLEHAQLFALLDKLGVNFNPAIVWNAMRWTFVVDWVFGVSQYLDHFKHANMEPVINIRRCLWSIDRRRSIFLSVDCGASREIPASTVRETAYGRYPFMPTSTSIQSSGLTLKEFSLGAALVSTRRPRH